MNRGHYVNFKNLSNIVELKELNGILNDMLRMMWERFDIGNPYKTYVFTKNVQCAKGESVNINYETEFDTVPTVIAYSVDGKSVAIDNSKNTKNGTSVKFTDPEVSGNINILATGKIKV